MHTNHLEVFETVDGRGKGLKTTREIPEGEVILEYTGLVTRMTTRGTEPAFQVYDADGHLSWQHEDFYIIRAFRIGSKARYINHCCVPNVDWDWKQSNGRAHCMITALKTIPAGHELASNYGRRYWSDRKESHLYCTCDGKCKAKR